ELVEADGRAGLGLAGRAVDDDTRDGGLERQQAQRGDAENAEKTRGKACHFATCCIGLPHSPQNFSSFSNFAPQASQVSPADFILGLGATLATWAPGRVAFSLSTSARTPASSFWRSLFVDW